MKRIISIVLTFFILSTEAAISNEEVEKVNGLPIKFLRSTGGFVIDKNAAKGNIAIINAQSYVGSEVIKKHLHRLELVLSMPVAYLEVTNKVDFSNLDAIIKAASGSTTVIVAENVAFPSLLVMPEKKCSIINVTAFLGDGPDMKKICDRTSKELARAICFNFALPYSSAPGSIMDPVFSLSQLDQMAVDNVGVAQKMLIERSASQHFGMRPYRRTTYLKACEEGWAATPADEFQKAIWDKVHAMPTEPLKIKPEEKKTEK